MKQWIYGSLCNAIIIANMAHRKEPFMIPLDLSHLSIWLWVRGRTKLARWLDKPSASYIKVDHSDLLLICSFSSLHSSCTSPLCDNGPCKKSLHCHFCFSSDAKLPRSFWVASVFCLRQFGNSRWSHVIVTSQSSLPAVLPASRRAQCCSNRLEMKTDWKHSAGGRQDGWTMTFHNWVRESPAAVQG